MSGKSTISASMEMYQREVVALIAASGTRLSVLHDHRVIELWREYSQRAYCCGWIEGNRQEVYRFVTWANNRRGLGQEILLAQRARVHGSKGIFRPRSYPLRARSGPLLTGEPLE